MFERYLPVYSNVVRLCMHFAVFNLSYADSVKVKNDLVIHCIIVRAHTHTHTHTVNSVQFAMCTVYKS